MGDFMSEMIRESRKMPRLRINEGRMFSAVHSGHPLDAASRNFLNRTTGEVFTLWDDHLAFDYVMDSAGGIHFRDLPALWMEHQERGRHVTADRSTWVEVPKYPGGGTGEEDFILDFLAKQGIDAELVEPQIPF
jgi:hypothetical protein